MEEIQVTIKAGRNTAIKSYNAGTKVSSLLNDTSLKVFLNAPENPSALNHRSETLTSDYVLQNNDVIYLQQTACKKA